MGIRFLCPNGHKLNVKSFLAGKRAICPKCGARVMVPDESPPDGQDESAEGLAELREDESLDESILTESALQSTHAASAPAASQIASVQPAADPLQEAPGAVWYVRPASGGQYGPASGEIMRSWIGDGRVAANSLVWRDGWPEWRAAAAVFPNLSGQLAAPAASPALPVGVPAATPGAAPPVVQPALAAELEPPEGAAGSTTLADVARRRRRKNDVSLIASAVLVVVSVILVIVLVLVFRSQSSGDDAQSGDNPPAGGEAARLTPISARS